MVWAKLDDEILDNPKVARAGVLGFAMHTAAITYCCRNLTDGFIPRRRVTALLDLSELLEEYVAILRSVPSDAIDRLADVTADFGAPVAQLLAHRLVKAGLWSVDEERDGYWLHDFLEYNPTREQVLGKRDREQERRSKRRTIPPPAAAAAPPPPTADSVPAPCAQRADSVPAPCRHPDPDPVPVNLPTSRVRAREPTPEPNREPLELEISPEVTLRPEIKPPSAATPPEWFAEAAVEASEALKEPVAELPARWASYRSSRSRKGWTMCHDDAVGWLCDVVRGEQQRDASGPRLTVVRPPEPPPAPYHREARLARPGVEPEAPPSRPRVVLVRPPDEAVREAARRLAAGVFG